MLTPAQSGENQPGDSSSRDSVSQAKGSAASYGLRREILSPLETLAQSVSTMAPSTTPAATIPLVCALAGNGTWLAYVLATDARLWQEPGDRSQAALVDGDLAVKLGPAAFQFASAGNVEGQAVYLLDRKHGLWEETMPSARGLAK